MVSQLTPTERGVLAALLTGSRSSSRPPGHRSTRQRDAIGLRRCKGSLGIDLFHWGRRPLGGGEYPPPPFSDFQKTGPRSLPANSKLPNILGDCTHRALRCAIGRCWRCAPRGVAIRIGRSDTGIIARRGDRRPASTVSAWASSRKRRDRPASREGVSSLDPTRHWDDVGRRFPRCKRHDGAGSKLVEGVADMRSVMRFDHLDACVMQVRDQLDWQVSETTDDR